MKKTASIIIALMLLSATTNAQTKHDSKKAETVKEEVSNWSNDASHTSVKFTVQHLTVSEVEGRFNTFTGTITSQSADFNNAKVNFAVDVNSITTDNDMRDKHLKSDDFFNAEKYPKMNFVSTSLKKVKGNVYTLEGDLTIRDVTKKITFAVYYGGTIKDPYGNIKAGFKASGKVSRKAYGLKWNALTEAGGAVVGDEITILLNMEFAKQKS